MYAVTCAISGLSPPTRGILGMTAALLVYAGSIPAYAGDPATALEYGESRRVYPRLRGGSRPPLTTQSQPTGLSPPTRGIRELDAVPRWM